MTMSTTVTRLAFLFLPVTFIAAGCWPFGNGSEQAGPGTAAPAVVATFADCVKAGYPVLESAPRQCKTPDGRTFVEPRTGTPLPSSPSPSTPSPSQPPADIPPPTTYSAPGCVNQCGNGACDFVVCQAAGCPCAEDPETCPLDCVSISSEPPAKKYTCTNQCGDLICSEISCTSDGCPCVENPVNCPVDCDR